MKTESETSSETTSYGYKVYAPDKDGVVVLEDSNYGGVLSFTRQDIELLLELWSKEKAP